MLFDNSIYEYSEILNENRNYDSYYNNDHNINLDISRNESILFSREYGPDYYDNNSELNIENYDIKEDESPINEDNKLFDLPNDRENKYSKKQKTPTKTKTTNDKTLFLDIVFSLKEKIFDIVKKPHFGRKTKKLSDNINNIKSTINNKKRKDNVLVKIKRRVYNYCLILINKLLKKNEKLKGKKLLKNENSLLSVCNKNENVKLLNLKLKEIFSLDISDKYKSQKHKKEENKNLINKIINENDEKLNLVLNKTFREMVELYCSDNIEDENFQNFNRLKDDLEEFKKEENENDKDKYSDLYEKYARNFEAIINNIDERPKKRKH